LLIDLSKLASKGCHIAHTEFMGKY